MFDLAGKKPTVPQQSKLESTQKQITDARSLCVPALTHINRHGIHYIHVIWVTLVEFESDANGFLFFVGAVSCVQQNTTICFVVFFFIDLSSHDSNSLTEALGGALQRC